MIKVPRIKHNLLLLCIAGFILGTTAAFIVSHINTTNETTTLTDFLIVGLAGASVAAVSGIMELDIRKFIISAVVGGVSAMLLLMLMVGTVRSQLNVYPAVAVTLLAFAIFSAIISTVDTIMDERSFSLSYTLLLSASGGIVGLALGFIFSQLIKLFIDSINQVMVIGAFYSAAVWLAIGISKKIALQEFTSSSDQPITQE